MNINKLSSVPNNSIYTTETGTSGNDTKRIKELTEAKSLYPKDIDFVLSLNNSEKKYLTKLEQQSTEIQEKWKKIGDFHYIFSPRTTTTPTSIINDKTREIAKHQETWLGSFVVLINKQTGLISRIKEVLVRIFTSIREEMATQEKLKGELNELVELKQLYNDYQGLLTTHRHKLVLQGDKKILGNRNAFEKLPILDIGNREGSTGYIDFIKPEEMTAPIMRGKDKYGREFFIIRARINGGEVVTQTFFRRYTKENTWSDANTSIIQHSGYIMDLGKVNLRPYNELKTLIKTGQVNAFRNTFWPGDSDHVRVKLC